MAQRFIHLKSGVPAALAAVILGWALLLPLGTPNPLVRWSCDMLQLVLPGPGLTNIAIVHMDDRAALDYKVAPGLPWPRSVHARLLDRLTADGARVVVFDAAMDAPSDTAADETFAGALRRNSRAVLAASKVKVTGLALSYTVIPPLPAFETNAAGWGTAKVPADPDLVVRRNITGDSDDVGLPWAAALVAGAPVTRDASRRLAEERWLNYYGASRPFEPVSMTYTNAEAAAAGFFRNKAVFIGGKSDPVVPGETADVFNTPFTKWNGSSIPGVEVIAIAWANLFGQDWLRRPGVAAELLLLLLAGAGAGFGLRRAGWRMGVWLACGMAVFVIAVSIGAVLAFHVWFPWLIVVGVQIPCALVFRLAGVRDEMIASLAAARAELKGRQERERAAAEIPTTSETIQDGRPNIPNHTLIRCIGEGAYGQVWLARNDIGLYHAVKVVYRSRFGMEAPYERALRGIQNFMPISRSHPGFVHILHVGNNERAGYFFYIMEAGDDQEAGQRIDAATYTARTLSNTLRVRGSLPPRECLSVVLALADAVDCLHQRQLIHRDIKPANIIFVNGAPKLADIDLVTTLTGPGEASRIGTEGYMAPEGPGTAAADVFSLGRVFYVALTGKGAAQCPELPTHLASHPDSGLFMELNNIICKACEFDLSRRYSTAARMKADLAEIARRLQSGQAPGA